MPLTEHPDLLYNSNVLTLALCIKLQHGTLYAPFSGLYDSKLLAGRRLRFRHSSGLVMQLDLPLCANISSDAGVAHLATSGASVNNGQSVMQLDLQAQQHCYAVLMILPHPAIAEVFSTRRYAEATKDIAFIIQTKNK